MKKQRAMLRLRMMWLRIRHVSLVVMVPWWFVTALTRNLRCRVFGWHTPASTWRLIYGEEGWHPLYWRYGQICSQCGMLRPGSFHYYRWCSWHGMGAVPALTPREVEALGHE